MADTAPYREFGVRGGDTEAAVGRPGRAVDALRSALDRVERSVSVPPHRRDGDPTPSEVAPSKTASRRPQTIPDTSA